MKKREREREIEEKRERNRGKEKRKELSSAKKGSFALDFKPFFFHFFGRTKEDHFLSKVKTF